MAYISQLPVAGSQTQIQGSKYSRKTVASASRTPVAYIGQLPVAGSQTQIQGSKYSRKPVARSVISQYCSNVVRTTALGWQLTEIVLGH